MTESLAASQARLQDDLRGLVVGDVRCDDVALQLYSSDGSPFEERPTGVVWPRSERDVAAVVRYAAEKGLSVHPRGSGTSGVAGSIGSGLILDFSRYFRRVLQAGDDFVRVQPGAVRERVNELLRKTKNRFFAPSSGHIPTGTIGSVLAVDNIGPRWRRYGAPRESVLGLRVVLADGSIRELRPFRARPVRGAITPNGAAAFRRALVDALIAEANPSGAMPRGANLGGEFAESGGGATSTGAFRFDFEDGFGARSLRSEAVREAFFRRFFGADADALRAWVRSAPCWEAALRIVREYEPFLDVEERARSPFRCGYPLRDFVRGGVDPARLFVGSEGTLGVIVEATLATVAPSAASSAVVLLFDSLEKAARAVPTILRFDPTLCDLLDSRVVALTRDWDSRFETTFPQAAAAALVVELDADSKRELDERTNGLLQTTRDECGSFGCWSAFDPEEKRLFRDLLQESSCARLRMAPSFQYFPFWEDLQLPVEETPAFLREIRELFKRERLIYSVGGHVGHGRLSIQPILPYSEDEERRAFALSERVEELVLRRGGEIGSAKGNGRVRTAATPRRFPNLFPAFVEIKDAFDPANRLNPDVVVSPEIRRLAADRARDVVSPTVPARRFALPNPFDSLAYREPKSASETPLTPASTRRDGFENGSKGNPDETRDASEPLAPLDFDSPTEDESDILAPETDAALRESALHSRTIRRRTPFDAKRLERDSQIDWLNRPKRSQIEFQLAWNPTLVYSATFQCVGCGRCRVRTAETRTCPAFRHAPDEQASCRAKANLLRGVFDGTITLDALTRENARRVADFCIRCHCCPTECPAQVDVPRLAFRLQSAYRAAWGLSLAELFVSKFDDALSVAARFSSVVGAALKSRSFRWALEKTLGIAQGRKLPALERRPFLSRVPKRRPLVFAPETPRAGRKVALFVDSFANFFDAKLVEAAIAVLTRCGVSVVVPPKPRSSGAGAFVIGDVDGAEAAATRNVSLFRELSRDGAEIVALEPSSAVCIKKEYPYFCDDADARVVFANTTDVCSYLARALRRGEFDVAGLRPLAGSAFAPRRSVDDVESSGAPSGCDSGASFDSGSSSDSGSPNGARPLVAGYHAPCRSLALSGAALGSPTAAQELLAAIPGLETRRLERGCCGLANYAGITKRRFDESLRLGTRLFLAMRDPEVDFCASECSFCNLQLAQGVAKPVAHVVKLLAASYGVFPLEDAFATAIRPPRR